MNRKAAAATTLVAVLSLAGLTACDNSCPQSVGSGTGVTALAVYAPAKGGGGGGGGGHASGGGSGGHASGESSTSGEGHVGTSEEGSTGGSGGVSFFPWMNHGTVGSTGGTQCQH